MTTIDETWSKLRAQARSLSLSEPALAVYLDDRVSSHPSFGHALSRVLHRVLAVPEIDLELVFDEVWQADEARLAAAAEDLERLAGSNPACPNHLCGFLAFLGFQAVQVHRATSWLWRQERKEFAVLIQNWAATRFAVDIHPAATVGRNVLFDHAIGIVIGETAAIGDGASLWHGVTLGATLREDGDRHPKVGAGAVIGAGAAILGNIPIGTGAVIGANSVVLGAVPDGTVATGAPAKVIGKASAWLKAIAPKKASHD